MSLDFNSWITVLGTVATIIFGYFGIRFALLKKYPGSIIYVEDQSTSLFNSLVKNFSEITVSYKDNNVSQQIALLKGFLINAGSIDIKPDMIEQNLAIMLPKDFKWLSAKIVDQTVGNNSTLLIIDDGSIDIDLHLFRKNEFLCFEALAEVPINDNEKDAGKILKNNVKFSHRIADTDKIKKQYISLETANFWTLRNFFRTVMIFLLGLFMLILSIFVEVKERNLRTICYSINAPNDKKLTVYASAQIDNTVDLKFKDGSLYKKIKIQDFNKNCISELKIAKPPKDDTIQDMLVAVIVLPSILILSGGYSFAYFFIEKRKITQLRKTLNLLQ